MPDLMLIHFKPTHSDLPKQNSKHQTGWLCFTKVTVVGQTYTHLKCLKLKKKQNCNIKKKWLVPHDNNILHVDMLHLSLGTIIAQFQWRSDEVAKIKSILKGRNIHVFLWKN